MPRTATRPSTLQLTIIGREKFAGLPARSTLRRWVRMALQHDAQLNLVFVNASAGRRLNREFRGRDYATNVLTFAYARKPLVAADIVLCAPVLRREARQGGRSLRSHVAHLVIHGVLHAQGFDHESRREALTMQAREQQLLARLRIADPYTDQ